MAPWLPTPRVGICGVWVTVLTRPAPMGPDGTEILSVVISSAPGCMIETDILGHWQNAFTGSLTYEPWTITTEEPGDRP